MTKQRGRLLGQLMLAMQPLPPGGAMMNYEGTGRKTARSAPAYFGHLRLPTPVWHRDAIAESSS
jgi:hypothetical protein